MQFRLRLGGRSASSGRAPRRASGNAAGQAGAINIHGECCLVLAALDSDALASVLPIASVLRLSHQCCLCPMVIWSMAMVLPMRISTSRLSVVINTSASAPPIHQHIHQPVAGWGLKPLPPPLPSPYLPPSLAERGQPTREAGLWAPAAIRGNPLPPAPVGLCRAAHGAACSRAGGALELRQACRDGACMPPPCTCPRPACVLLRPA